MIERPLLFTAPMARAMIDGTKTETRRLTGLELINERPDDFDFRDFIVVNGKLYAVFYDNADKVELFIKSRYGMAGDFIWGRETFYIGMNGKPIYKATNNSHLKKSIEDLRKDRGEKWKPSIHMPRKASRIHRELADMRVERLHEITEEAARAEGMEPFGIGYRAWENMPSVLHARHAYQDCWNAINGPGSWDRNPWVWVLVFKPEAKK